MVGANSGPLIVQSRDIASAQIRKAPTREDQTSKTRELQGEILIPADLAPGCDILNFTLQVRELTFITGQGM